MDVLRDTERSCGLPGVACDACGNTWADLGIGYPTIGCADLDIALPSDPWPIAPATFVALRDKLRRCVGDERPLRPGTTIGPIIAPLKREPPDVLHHGLAFLVSERVAEDAALRDLGLRLARTVLHTVRGKKRVVMYELEAWALAQRQRRSSDRIAPPCRVCGYQRFPAFRNEPLLPASVDGHHAVRLAEIPAIMFVSAALKAVLERHQATASPDPLTFKAVKLV